MLEEWKENQNNAAWVRDNREELMELTGLEIPSRLSKISYWLDSYKGEVTKRLKADETEEEDGGEDDGES